MSDISLVRIDGIDYNIKDKVAREEAAKKIADAAISFTEESIPSITITEIDGKKVLDVKIPSRGERGFSAYEIWLSHGNSGTEEDYLASLKGEKGEPASRNLSELNNDAGFITKEVNDLFNYYNKTDADSLLNNKVDKIEGKGLSTNDYSDTEKTQVANNKSDILLLKENVTELQNSITITTSAVLENSKEGVLELIEIEGNTVQNGTPTPDTPQPLNHYGDCVEMMQGVYNGSAGIYEYSTECICSKNPMPCKSGDTVKVTLSETAKNIYLMCYGENGYITYLPSQGNVTSSEFTIPSGVTKCHLRLDFTSAITPQTVGKIQLTVNGKYLGCVRGHGKNFVKYLDNNSIGKVGESITGAGITATRNKDGSVTLVGTTTQANVFFNINWLSGTKAFPNGKYISSGSTKNVNVQIVCTNGAISSRDSEFTIDDSKSDNWLRLQINASGTVVNETVYPMVRKADITDDTYEPYKETIEWYYTNEPIRLGDYMFRDSDGLVKIQRNVAERTFIGANDEAWAFELLSANNVNRKRLDLSDAKLGASLCDSFTYLQVNESDKYFLYKGTRNVVELYFVEDISTRNSVVLWKEWLASNPIKVQYPLATPTIEVLDTQSQINLNSIETFDGVTYLECDSRVQPTSITTRYATTETSSRSLVNTNRLGKLENSFEIIKENYENDIDELNATIGNKVDKVNGKALSTNDYTTAEKTKLSGIQTGAQVNWNATISGSALILN